MKKWLLGAALAVISAVAFALPSPHQIEGALAAHDYDNARSMTQEVLRERPDSAKAHLFDAFLLEHVDGNLSAANQELQNVVNLDQRGDVKGSALFGKTVAEIDAKGQVVRQAQQTQQVTQYAQTPVTAYVPPEKRSGHGFLIFLIVFGIAALLVWLFIRGATRRKTILEQRTYYDDNSLRSLSVNTVGSSGTGRAYISSPTQPQIIHTPYVQPVQSGPVIINNGGGYGRGYGNDGFTEGLIVGELLEDRRDARRGTDSWSRDSSYDRTPVVSNSGSGYSSSSSDSSSVSAPVERASYSSGSDNSWSSPSSSSDYSSSSSSDYSSSSSSDYSSSSSDYSSSSSDSSW